MKTKIIQWILALPMLMLMLTACAEEEWLKQSAIGDKEVLVNVPFGSTNHSPVVIESRNTYDLRYESMVLNLYVYVFVNGERVYGHYFDNSNLIGGNGVAETDDAWSVTNKTDNSTETAQTQGTVRMKVPVVTDGGADIVMIANLDLDFINVSHERLSLVRNKAELEAMVASLNQEFPDRNAGYFVMTGSVSGASIHDNGSLTLPASAEGKIRLRRLDAKVEVNVKVDAEAVRNNLQVREFLPESWQVMNLPNCCYLMEQSTDAEETEKADGYFSASPKAFEATSVTDNVTTNSFSFYMMENRETMKKTTSGNYHLRDMRLKNDDGTYNTTNGLWEYAPEYGTYLVIKGELNMLVNPSATNEYPLTADVTYYVHLGNFGTEGTDDYNIKRNTHYTYNITLYGVNSILVEVETSNDDEPGVTETQPGATGNTFTAEEEIFTFDAHYGQRVYNFPASSINVDAMTWYVKTPFGREGTPQKDPITGQEIYNDLDYKWVEFMVNDLNSDGLYSNANHPYPGTTSDQLMDIVEFMTFLKAEKIKYTANQENAFDKDGNLRVTIFVNEYYYDVDPMNPNNTAQDLWKRFVNQPNRLLHILCESAFSLDGASSKTGSIVTIRQRSIQTPYNLTKASLMEGWGCETVDETYNVGWFYSPKETATYTPPGYPVSGTANTLRTANTSRTDGLYNTACLLQLVKSGSVDNSLKWSTYLDYTDNDVQLNADYQCGLYSVMLRNRDLDGDGNIDPNELRWYIASLDQLCGLFLGDQGLSTEAQLYPITAASEPDTPLTQGPFAGAYPWRLHVVSSTASGGAGTVPTVVWAEEGASTGPYKADGGEQYGKIGYSPIRCVRNLGIPEANATTITVAGSNYPREEDRLVLVTPPSSSTGYRFNFSNINDASLRYYTTHEFIPTDEYSVGSRLYKGFETGGLGEYGPYTLLKENLENLISPSPTGYRVPNVREGVVMHLYCDKDYYNNDWWKDTGIIVCNYYSFGSYGNRYDCDNVDFYSWSIFKDRVTVGNPPAQHIRFVKDWTPE